MNRGTKINFIKNEDGAGNAMSIMWAVAFLGLSGVAIDGANGWRVQNQIQVAMDSAAMSAAPLLPDEDAALAKAVEVARLNLPPSIHGDIINVDSVKMGAWDSETQTLDVEAEVKNAVVVRASRDAENGTGVRTFLFKLFGTNAFSTDAQALAVVAYAPGGGPRIEERLPTCAAASFLTSNFIDTGGGNRFNGEVCLHGATGVRTGGGDFLGPQLRISAERLSDITINATAPGSAAPEDVTVEQEISPRILPQLTEMFDARWDALYESGVSTYSGDLIPANVFRDDGTVDVVQINEGFWTIEADDLQPNTVYMVNHGAQFAGEIDAQDIAIIARGQIGVGGGPGLKFNDVFLFGTGALNFSGDVEWGRAEDFCDSGRFNTYLFSYDSVSLGGSGHTYGVVGAAPRFAPGGAMKAAGGVYFEASQFTALGGDMDITGCEVPLASDFELTEQEPEQVQIAGTRRIGRLAR